MIRRPRRRVKRTANGRYEVNLPDEERNLLATLPSRLIGALNDLTDPDNAIPEPLARLFPPAYPTDQQAEASYVSLVRHDLLEHHRQALTVLEDTARATTLDEDQMQSWLGALNDLRLALGTVLEVTEEPHELDPNDPDYVDWVCYQYLSYLQNELLDVLSDALPPPVTGADDALPEDPWGAPPGGLRWDGTDQPSQG